MTCLECNFFVSFDFLPTASYRPRTLFPLIFYRKFGLVFRQSKWTHTTRRSASERCGNVSNLARPNDLYVLRHLFARRLERKVCDDRVVENGVSRFRGHVFARRISRRSGRKRVHCRRGEENRSDHGRRITRCTRVVCAEVTARAVAAITHCRVRGTLAHDELFIHETNGETGFSDIYLLRRQLPVR